MPNDKTTPRTDAAAFEIISDLQSGKRWVVDKQVCALIEADLLETRARLPESMQTCTILFKECDKGHGWLTATNWVQDSCPRCYLAQRDATIAELTARAEKAEGKAQQVIDIWCDCLGGKVYPKWHFIDSLGKTTRLLTKDRDDALARLSLLATRLRETGAVEALEKWQQWWRDVAHPSQRGNIYTEAETAHAALSSLQNELEGKT